MIENILQVNNLTSGYGKKKVIFDMSFEVSKGEVVGITGHNGAGKSTLLNTLFGLIRPMSGNVLFEHKDITAFPPASRIKLGLSFVPQGKRVFPELTVIENLELGAYINDKKEEFEIRLKEVYDVFPILKERTLQKANTLSGGEQQMLAMGRALMLTPKFLLLDEPSLGLAPIYIEKVMNSIREINQAFGTTVLIVEQNKRQLLSITNKVYVMKVGRISLVEKAEELLTKESLKKILLN